MNDEQQRIWDYLTENAQGIQNRVSSDQIRDNCGLEAGGVTNEHVRGLIREMILNFTCCIGSDSRGYWIIQSDEELNIACNGLIQRADENNRRQERLREIWRTNNG